jgi:hypothetical protein
MRTPDSTDGPAADSIRVDLAGLARLAANLRSLAAEMASRDGGLQDALADPDQSVETEIGRAASSGAR